MSETAATPAPSLIVYSHIGPHSTLLTEHTAEGSLVLRDDQEVQESSGLVTPFAERQRLVGKPEWDALEKRYS